MSEESKQPYWYEVGNKTNLVCEDYEILHGPDRFECVLTEPEDRWFGRDCRPMVQRLNEQHARLATATELLRECREHVLELEEAWRVGAISEHDGQGGTRSNRNVDIRARLAAFLEGCRTDNPEVPDAK